MALRGGDERQAIRIVDAELYVVAIHLNQLAEFQAVPDNILKLEGERRFLPTTAWEENKDTLARHLPQELWERLFELYAILEQMRFGVLLGQPG
jgi:hypothetical protein